MIQVDKTFLKSNFLPIWELLEDENINEIKISPVARGMGQVWVKKSGGWYECKNKDNTPLIITDNKINAMIEYVAGVEQKFAHDKENILEANIPIFDFRFTGVKQPTSIDCATFNIRKTSSKIFTLEDYNNFGTFPEHINPMLDSWINNITNVGHRDKFSVGIFGGNESGKTTFQNAYIDMKLKRYPQENWVVIEDTKELQIAPRNVTRGQCTEYVDMEKLLKTAKRQTPDNLVIGEVRSGEASLVIESALIYNTIFGMHAKTFDASLKVMERMMLKNEFIDKVDKKDLCNITGWLGFQNVPETTEDANGNVIRTYRKRLTEMVELYDYDKNKDEFQKTTLYRFDGFK